MASSKSYTITLRNNRTERDALDLMLRTDPLLHEPDSDGRKALLDRLGIDGRLSRAFDMVKLKRHVPRAGRLQLDEEEEFELIEIKSTKKYLPELPSKFFFGATENEFELGRQATAKGVRYCFAFVSLHPDSEGHAYVDIVDIDEWIRSKRIQYQINLK